MSEIHEEAVTTRRILERVPGDKLSWRPHPKSMSLGQLALHIATVPGNISKLAQLEEFEVPATFSQPAPSDKQEVMTTLDAGLKAAEEYLSGVSETAVMGTWRLKSKGKEMFNLPRIGLLRTLMLNHWYHHRGQLSVYLRLLDVPVPVVYGPTADEAPF